MKIKKKDKSAKSMLYAFFSPAYTLTVIFLFFLACLCMTVYLRVMTDIQTWNNLDFYF